MKRKNNNIGSASQFSRAELGFMVHRLSVILDEHIDAIWLAAADEGFLTPERIGMFTKTQRDARLLAEAFAPQEDFEVAP
jgi:hypothetical protein